MKIASPSFYSLRDARTPIIVSLVTIAVESGAEPVAALDVMGFRGLALGTAIAANVNAGLLLCLLSRRIGGIDAGRVAAYASSRSPSRRAVMGVAACVRHAGW